MWYYKKITCVIILYCYAQHFFKFSFFLGKILFYRS